MACFLIYYVISLVRLRYRLIGAVPYDQDEDIYFSDNIAVPFVIGIVNPKIYLPSTLMDKEIGYIVIHETYHIRRKDHILKPLALLALTIHWFNPCVWLAFYFMTKDMESSCDEAVLRKLNEDERNDYLMSLLQLATGKKLLSGGSIAFGEGDTKSRINNIIKWENPSILDIVLAMGIAVSIIVICILIPKNKTVDHPYKWLREADLNRITCEYVDEIVLRDLAYVLHELNISDFQTYTMYKPEIELCINENGQEVRLIYGEGVTLFLFEDNILSEKVWGTQNKDLVQCMKAIRNNRKENIVSENYIEEWKPSKEDVKHIKEKVFKDVREEDLIYITDLAKVINLELESIFLYENQFEEFENVNSESWDSIDYDKYRLYINGIGKRMKNDLLKKDINEMIFFIDQMEKEHDVKALRSFFYKIHDMDYYFFRYGADELWYYIHDTSFVRTYYGALHVYDDIRAD